MNKILIALFFFAIQQPAFGQIKSDSLFAAGGKFFEQGNYSAAVTCYKEIVFNYNSSDYYNQSVYNLAYTYNSMDSDDLAIFWYEKIRSSNVSDSTLAWGRGILEPYANYKHYSSFNLGNIQYKRGNYEKALDYYMQCQTLYPYYNNSGTDLRINKNRLAIYITDCLEKLKRYDVALATIVPEALDSYGSSNYKSVVKRAMSLIEKQLNDKQELKEELSKALETLKSKGNNYDYSFFWRGKSYELHRYFPSDIPFAKEIKQSDFWIQLTQ